MKELYYILFVLISSSVLNAQSFTSTTTITDLKYPVAFDVATDGRTFITEKGDGSNTTNQKSRILIYSNTNSLIGTFYELSDSTNSSDERGVLGIALDPDFATNHYVYVYYNHLFGGDERIRIARFTEAANIGTNPTIIFDLDVPENIPGNHVGGNLHFRPSQPDKIYFSLGDLGYYQTNASLNYANKITNPFGKILRINKNGTVPTDNPFYDDGDPFVGTCDWIWSYGHRNPFDFCFSPVNDSLYSSENGLSTWDEVNLITKGGYYGWAECEGNYLNSSTTTPCNATNAINPLVDWGSPLPAVTGILFYSGSVWASINNHLIVADNDNGYLYDCTLGNPPHYDTVTHKVQMGDLTASGGLTTLKQGLDGCIYAMHGGYTTNGSIYKVCPLSNSLEENTETCEINFYPNPVKDILSIEICDTITDPIRIEILDITGKVLKQKLVDSKTEKNSLQINVNDILGGTYPIQVKSVGDNRILKTSKIVIE